MAKISRKKKTNSIKEGGKEINLDTGEVTTPPVKVWSVSLQTNFAKCVSLVEKIKERSLNLIDETNIASIAYSLVCFEEKGKNLFDQVCLFQNKFGTEQLEALWKEGLEKSTLKSPFKFIRLCRDRGLEVKNADDDSWEYKIVVPGQLPRALNDELVEKDVEDIHNYGFIEKDNCYYFAEYNFDAKICTLRQKSNFILKILFHINRGKQNKRVIELINYRGKRVTLDIETKQLTSYQLFKELTEGQGNFVFDGSVFELAKIKSKLFELEKPSRQIDMLGWNNEGKFFAFSNGIFGDKFYPVDEHGIVTYNDKNYFIPYHPKTDEYSYLNEKRFSFRESDVTFEQWSELYCQAFGKVGEVALVFVLATLFSDHIFFVRGNFPMLFLYGEGGSGKSRVGMYGQYLFGEPQPPLKLTEKANTDKSKIRKLAQYVNAMILLEEFSNELDIAAIKTITGFYDRFGYERSNLDSKFGTETVPINSTAMVTGNSYPTDDPLLQRFILADYNANRRDEKVNKAYDALTELNRKGLTGITGKLIQYRPEFARRFERYFRPAFDDFKKKLVEKKIMVPDRMVENYSVIITTYKVLHDVGVKFPFKLDGMINFLIDTIQSQAEKRDTGSVIQRFFDIMLQLANEGAIQHGREYIISGENVMIRMVEIHGLYMEKHSRIYRSPGLNKTTLIQKLKDSGIMETSRGRIGGSTTTTCYNILYDKMGIDLLSVAQYWESRNARYRSKSDGNEAEKLRNAPGQREIAPGWEDGQESHRNPVKPSNQPENDDLPF